MGRALGEKETLRHRPDMTTNKRSNNFGTLYFYAFVSDIPYSFILAHNVLCSSKYFIRAKYSYN